MVCHRLNLNKLLIKIIVIDYGFIYTYFMSLYIKNEIHIVTFVTFPYIFFQDVSICDNIRICENPQPVSSVLYRNFLCVWMWQCFVPVFLILEKGYGCCDFFYLCKRFCNLIFWRYQGIKFVMIYAKYYCNILHYVRKLLL